MGVVISFGKATTRTGTRRHSNFGGSEGPCGDRTAGAVAAVDRSGRPARSFGPNNDRGPWPVQEQPELEAGSPLAAIARIGG